MALDDLLAKLGPSVVRELTPHVVQMVGGVADRFRKDTREAKASVESEIATLGALQQEINERLRGLGEADDAIRLQLTTLEQKLDGLVERQAGTVAQLTALEHAVRSARTPPPALLWAILASSLLSLGAAIGVLVLHR